MVELTNIFNFTLQLRICGLGMYDLFLDICDFENDDSLVASEDSMKGQHRFNTHSGNGSLTGLEQRSQNKVTGPTKKAYGWQRISASSAFCVHKWDK